MKAVGIIPARLESQRLPRKPVADILGSMLIERVYAQALKSQELTEVYLTSDSDEIESIAKVKGLNFIKTGSHHITGTERVAEAYEILSKSGKEFDMVANVQGDMPFINPFLIDGNISLFRSLKGKADMVTPCTPIFDIKEYERPASVKVVIGKENRALYFSRAPIPFLRNPEERSSDEPYSYKHMGLYVFSPSVLAQVAELSIELPESREKLEQLRLLAHGFSIYCYLASQEETHPSIEVDTPDDLQRAIEFARTLV